MPIYGPDLEPLDRVVKVRLSERQLRALDRLREEFSMTRAWFLREALAIGVLAAAEHLRRLRAEGLQPAGALRTRSRTGPLRGPRSDGARTRRLGPALSVSDLFAVVVARPAVRSFGPPCGPLAVAPARPWLARHGPCRSRCLRVGTGRPA